MGITDAATRPSPQVWSARHLLTVSSHFTQSVKGSYNGVVAELAATTNAVRNRLNSAVHILDNFADDNHLGDAIEFRKIGDTSEHQGEFRNVIQGINDTRDSRRGLRTRLQC
jgi:hypothetical protein